MNKKKILARKAIAALLLASSFSMSADAASNLDLKDVYSARGGCAGAKQGCAAATPRGGCAAASTPDQTDPRNAQQLPKQTPNGHPTTPNTPPKSGCGAQSQPRPSSGCAAQSYRPDRPASNCAARQARPTAGCAAASSDNMPANAPMSNQMRRDANQMRRDANQKPQNSGTTSTYQGTTTGPGPNGGYPETPRGTYPIQPGSRN